MLHSRLLKYLDEVSRLGSIRKAAARLNVASSAINRQILALENELGAPIFERMPRRLRLTSTGEILIAHVRETLKGHQRVEAQIEALKGLARGEATIATMNGLAAGPLPRFLSSILDRHPRVHLRVRVLPFDQMTNALITGEADLALTYNPPTSPGLRIVASHDLGLGAVVSPRHPLTKRRPLRLADCAEFPLAIADFSMTIRPAVDLAFTHAGIPLHPTIETNSIEFMKKAARSGQAITFLNAVDVAEEVAAGEICHLPLDELSKHPIALKLMVRARGGLDAFPSLVVEELRRAMPKLDPIDTERTHKR
jgi:DNA-binding transcriptional LysR family regulator